MGCLFRRPIAALVVALGCGAVPSAAATTSPAPAAAPIYNGSPTAAYPAVVAVGVRNAAGTIGLCSGTLIAPTVVLTAGHCLAFGPVAALVAIFPDGVTEVDLAVTRVEVHPDFELNRLAVADAGVVILADPVTNVAPLGLVASSPRPHTRGTIVGFGDAAEGGTGIKRAGSVRLTRCPRAVPKVGLAAHQLAGSLCWRPKRRGQDTCHGDSGGPLLVGDAVAGITSGGFPDCPGRLSWDTSVAAVRAWIDDVVARAALTMP